MSYLLASDDNVFRLPETSREISLWADLSAFLKILAILRKERPDIVHTHTAKAGALELLAACIAGVPIVVHTYHGHVLQEYFGALKSRVYRSIERLLGCLSTRVIAISDSQLEELSSKYRVVPGSKISVIQNGFELGNNSIECRDEARKDLGLARDAFVVAWTGRFVPVKDVQLLARVITQAAASQRKIVFLIVGDGPDKQELKSLIQGCTNARLLGWRYDMDSIWSAADAALLTSRNEGTPTALIEAMAAGRPFISTNVGAVRDLAVDPLEDLPNGMGHRAANGFLASRTSSALFYCIQQIAADSLMAKQMGSVGREFAVKRFSADRLVDDMVAFYGTLLQSRRRKAFSAIREMGEGACPNRDVV